MPKIRYITFGGCTGLEIRDEEGTHLCNILPPKLMSSKNVPIASYFTQPCEFTYDDLLEAIHKMRKGAL